ncbi:hypothetical protein BC938DRAFT_481047 [Jimgerdemannia flammicorona]|uniref:Uncharacterized protein n=1 Tax=Jimgerdemannia flammicorona TaxID=994334 RepID=A0A433QH71_9FUNG|nr:hypothetical protein BC938DRAFT_481047 [Jimgerdemannia flammicorona]
MNRTKLSWCKAKKCDIAEVQVGLCGDLDFANPLDTIAISLTQMLSLGKKYWVQDKLNVAVCALREF